MSDWAISLWHFPKIHREAGQDLHLTCQDLHLTCEWCHKDRYTNKEFHVVWCAIARVFFCLSWSTSSLNVISDSKGGHRGNSISKSPLQLPQKKWTPKTHSFPLVTQLAATWPWHVKWMILWNLSIHTHNAIHLHMYEMPQWLDPMSFRL